MTGMADHQNKIAGPDGSVQMLFGPRTALSIALTIFSMTMIGRSIGPRVDSFSVERQVTRVKNGAMHYYKDVELVYQIARRVRSLEQQEQQTGRNAAVDGEDSETAPQQDEQRAKPNLLMAQARVPSEVLSRAQRLPVQTRNDASIR